MKKKSLMKTGFIGAFIGFFVLLFPIFSHAQTANEAENQFSFGVVPQQSASKLARLWTPFLQYLSEKTGYTIQFKTAKDIPTFEKRLAAGEYDFAYMNPYHYIVFHRSPGYRALAKEKHRKLKGIIIVRKDSNYRYLSQLKGKTLAFPAPAAFAATVLPRAYLGKYRVSHIPKYVSSHDSVYRTVAKGLYPAGGGIVRTFNKIDPEVRNKLRIIWRTPGSTPHAFAFHPRINKEVARRIKTVLINMHKDPRGARLLKALGFKELATAHNADYNDIRALGIKQLDFLLKK